MKTIGVLGGLGPQATMDFERRLHRAAQARIPPRGNGGYPPMIVYYCRFPPVLVDENMLPLQPVQPDPRLLEAARALGRLSDFLVITANGPHMLQGEIEAAAGKEVLSMVGLALDELERRGWQALGLLTLGAPELYRKPAEERGLVPHTLPADRQGRLDEAIFRVMEGRDGAEDRKVARAAVQSLLEAGADGVLLGCTEIPLLLGEPIEAEPLINPAQLLAESAVERALA